MNPIDDNEIAVTKMIEDGIASAVNANSLEREFQNTPDFMCGQIGAEMLAMVTYYAQLRDNWYGWQFEVNAPSAKLVYETCDQALRTIHAKAFHTDPDVRHCLDLLGALRTMSKGCIPIDMDSQPEAWLAEQEQP